MPTETEKETPEKAREFKTPETIYKETTEKSRELIKPVIEKILSEPSARGLELENKEYRFTHRDRRMREEKAGERAVEFEEIIGETPDGRKIQETILLAENGDFLAHTWEWGGGGKEGRDTKMSRAGDVLALGREHTEKDKIAISNPEEGLKRLQEIKDIFKKGDVNFF